ncbi:Transcription factor HNF-4 homolog [Strongyloides ratti]|uniref:Transcription factor HNF-4 homolog n=1 Tax=Strongyloides ratti TaxID=34506 RepID=A0A090MUT4_STRRB|nr:Transcription factor HNF-4 homolog [Strongyloides ratti]CEF62423.1 Transcription factor HNF-4 homolog [Strongyloides ratti]
MTIVDAIGNLSHAISGNNTINDIALCEVCGDYSDGYHYKIQACRSCTAFIRRCVTFNKTYRCRFSNNCQIDFRNRNTCKGCRYNKCLMKGMDTSLVQPKREPTGAQPYRRKRELKVSQKDSNKNQNIPSNKTNNSLFSLNLPFTNRLGVSEDKPSTSKDYTLQNSTILSNISNISTLSSHNISETALPTPSEIFLSSMPSKFCQNYMAPFYKCVKKYCDLQLFNSHLSVPFPHFLIDNMETSPPLRIFNPSDTELLCRMQISNLFSWLSSMHFIDELSNDEKINLTKRFALKKISLDTMIMTSKYPEQIDFKSIVLENYTLIPSDMTGYEKDNDTESVRLARLAIFRESINDIFETIIKSISELKLTEYEIVTLYFLLFWSKSNEKFVSQNKVKLFEGQRNWVIKCLYTHYCKYSINNCEVRLGEIMLLLNELEWNYITNCKDYLISQLFNVGILKTHWFDKFCYSDTNFQL